MGKVLWASVLIIAAVLTIALYLTLQALPSSQLPPQTASAPSLTSLTTSSATATPSSTSSTTSSATPPSVASPQFLVIKDVVGREVRIRVPVKRAVAMGPGALRLVVYLNATDILVGIEAMEKRPPQGRDYGYVIWAKNLTNLPIVGQGGPDSPVNFEAIMAVKPDVIIMTPALANTPDEVQQKTGIPVVVVSYGTTGSINFTELFYSLKVLGKVLGREQRAEQLIAYMKSLIADLKARTANITNRPTVYVGAVSFKGGRPFTSTQAGFPPLVLLNTPNVADKYGIKPGAQISWEALLQAQPDVVFVDLGNYMTVLQDYNRSRDLYCSLKAFKEGRVYGILPFNFYWTNIATMFADAYYMGKVLYPNRFADVDPIAKANEIYEVFLGMPLYHKIAKNFGGGFRKLSFPCG